MNRIRKGKFLMTDRERFLRVMNFQPADRLPVIEWAPWWKPTLERWHREGLPDHLPSDAHGYYKARQIRDYFGMDRWNQMSIGARTENTPEKPAENTPEKPARYQGIIRNMDDYLKIKPSLYPEKPFAPDWEVWEKFVKEQQTGSVLLVYLEGYFYFPRELLGVEEHLCAFYDQPELIHAINRDLVEYQVRALHQLFSFVKPDMIEFSEDLAYNKGTMISKAHFEEFLTPYYRQILPLLKETKIVSFVDSDGNIHEVAPWLVEAGFDGMIPMERQAGVDIIALRKAFPKLRMLGGYDKMVQSKGRKEMTAEFERLKPVIRQGGFIPATDHQTPPEVSLDMYRIYLRLLQEYCEIAAR